MAPPPSETVTASIHEAVGAPAGSTFLVASSTSEEINPREFELKLNIGGEKHRDALNHLPRQTRARYERHGVDLSKGYPSWPDDAPLYLDEAIEVRNEPWEHVERGKNADPEKKALFSAAKEVKHLTKYVGTEIIGLQLADLTNQQRDELALLIAERTVVFFRGQDLSPQKQLELGEYYGKVEVHPKVPFVPGYRGTTVLWPKLANLQSGKGYSFKHPFGASLWHTDLTHELQPAGITHLHNDTIPPVGGDTIWSSGYGAYDKLSKPLQEFLDGKTAIYQSAHPYVDRNDPLSGPKFIQREHKLVRTHPTTGWKSLFVNRSFTKRIVGLEPKESDAILALLFDVYESNLDIQVRFTWQPAVEGLGTSALWDNRISQHRAVSDFQAPVDPETVDTDESARHGTRVTSLAETPYLDPNSKSQREALGLPN